jgi:hypothetical protein
MQPATRPLAYNHFQDTPTADSSSAASPPFQPVSSTGYPDPHPRSPFKFPILNSSSREWLPSLLLEHAVDACLGVQ